MVGLNRRPVDLACSLPPVVDEQKARFSCRENNITKEKTGKSMQPCFTALLSTNDSETLPSYWTTAFVLV